jgi:hypothetical protein
MSDVFEAVTSKFSFAAILIGDLLQGALFIVINGPVFFVIFRTGVVPDSLLDAYKAAASAAATATVKDSGAEFLIIAGFGVLCFALAQCLNPLAKIAGIIVGKILKLRGHRGFTSYDVALPTYPVFVARLIRDPIAKGHWEWELFMFYQRRAATVTFFVWLILLGWIRYVHWGPYFRPAYALEAFIALVVFCGTLRTMLESSKIMRRTHDLYAELPELPYRASASLSAGI